MTSYCEHCGTTKPAPDAADFALFDYCAECSRNLCDECMKKGCCGRNPALSGTDEDNGPDSEAL